MEQYTILSGMRPTGALHIGHLFGALGNWKKLQDDGHRCFYMVADWHALSTEYAAPGAIEANVREIAFDYLAAGLDPERSTIFIQSSVPEHAELHLLFSMFTPIAWLERNPVFKEQLEEIKEKDLHMYGFLGYPVLQAADILVYRATHVPIGVDQRPHLELTREIARRFNHLYGETFPEPAELLTATPKIPGTDNRKMSKSYGNCIFLKDDPETVRQKAKNMFTDPTRIYRKDPGHPETCPVFAYTGLTEPGAQDGLAAACRGASIGCIECKKALGERLIAFLGPIQERRRSFEKDPESVRRILLAGGERARAAARETLTAVRDRLKINFGAPWTP